MFLLFSKVILSFKLFSVFLGQSALPTTDNEWDFMPAGRIKSIHALGGVCKFRININNSIYSGVLKNGTRTGIMRVSGNGTASAAMKFLRSGVSSGNVVFQRLSTEYDIYNVFEPEMHTLSTHRNGINEHILEQFHGIIKDSQASRYSFAVGVSDLAK